MLCLDLIIVSLIGLFMMCIGSPMYLLPLVVLRLWLSFSVYYRKRSAGWVCAIFLVYAFVLVLKFDPDSVFLLPVSRLYDYAWMAITGDSTLLEGAFRSLQTAPRVSIPCPWLWWIVAVALGLWFFFYPLVANLVERYVNKNLVHDRMPWKKVIALAVAYALAVYGGNLYSSLCVGFDASYRIIWFAAICIVLIPFVPYLSWRLRPAVRRYLACLAVAIPAVFSGYLMVDTFGIVVLVVCSIGLFLLFVKNDRHKKLFSPTCIYVGIAAVLFWTAQYCLGITHICFLVGSIALFFFVAFTNVRLLGGQKFAWAYFIVAAFLLPSVAIGYNPFRDITYARTSNCYDYNQSPRGLIYVYAANTNVGIRDRFGLVLPPDYNHVMPIGEKDFPFFMVSKNGRWGVYDLVRQTLVIPVDFGAIYASSEREWDLYSSSYSYHETVEVPDFYSPFDPSTWPAIPDYEFDHPLDKYMLLKYDCRLACAESADEILCRLMIPYIKEDEDSVPDADYKWQWAQEMIYFVDSINDYNDLFYSEDVYGDAMTLVQQYVGESGIGAQAEMNCYSYVLSVAQEFKALASNIEVANILQNLDVKREFALFDDYLHTLRVKDSRLDEVYQRFYTMRPLEINHQNEQYYKRRYDDLESLIAVNNNEEVPTESVPVVTDAQIHNYYQKMKDDIVPQLYSVGYDQPTIVDTLSTKFFNWINYRESLAKKMPKRLAKVYRNQTDQIRYLLLNPPIEEEEDLENW